MATASELRDLIRPRPMSEAFGGISGKEAAMAALGIFSPEEYHAEKAVGGEMKKLAKRYISVLQAITGVKKGWTHSATSTNLGLDNEDAGIIIDISWKGNAITKKVDVVVDIARREGPERPGAKWRNKIYIARDIVPNAMNLSPTKIITDPTVRTFLKEHAEELMAMLNEDEGWEELAEAAMNRKKLERAIYRAMPVGSKGTYKKVGSQTMKSTLKRGGEQTIMFTGDLARRMGRNNYDSATLASLSDDEIHQIAKILGIVEETEEAEMSEVQELRAIIERKGSPYTKGKAASEVEFAKKDKKLGFFGGAEDLKRARKEAARAERRSKKREIEARMRGEGIDEAIAVIDEGEVVLIDSVLDEAKADFVDIMGPRFTDGDYTVWVNVGRAAAQKLTKKKRGGYIYLRDPERRMQDTSHRNDFALTVSRELGIPRERIMINPIRSPRSGDAGWKVEVEPELVPGGTKRDVDTAFALLAKALGKTMLDTEKGPKRKANADEFMLMNFAHDHALFKHHDTRNYVFVDMRTGKMTVPKTSKPFNRGYFDVFEDVEPDGEGLEEVNKYDIRRSEEAWKDAEAIADSYKEDGDPRERKARADAAKLKKDHDALMAKWEKQKKKSREYSRARAGAMRSVGMVRTRSGQWEDENDVTKLRSLIEYKGTPYGKSKGSREADLWGSEHGEKKHVGSKRRSGHSTTAKKMAHKGERQAAKKEIQARMRGEDVSLDDLGAYLEILGEELDEAMAGAQTEPVQPVVPMQMANLKIIQQTADQLSRFTKEFATYLNGAMRAKQVDVARLGQFGRQVDAAHRIFKDTYRKLALGYREDMGWDDEADAIEAELDAVEEAMAIGRGAAYEVPSPVPFAKKATLAGRRSWRKQLRKYNIPMGAQEMMMELAQIMASLPASDRKLVDQMMNMTWYGPEDLGGPEMKSYVDAIKKLHKRVFGRIRGNPTR